MSGCKVARFKSSDQARSRGDDSRGAAGVRELSSYISIAICAKNRAGILKIILGRGEAGWWGRRERPFKGQPLRRRRQTIRS